MRFLASLLATFMVAITLLAAKPEKTSVFTLNPPMHCQSCETKIKTNLRFVSGVKEIKTSIPDQTVTIRYDSTKTDTTRLIRGFAKIGYNAKTVR